MYSTQKYCRSNKGTIIFTCITRDIAVEGQLVIFTCRLCDSTYNTCIVLTTHDGCVSGTELYSLTSSPQVLHTSKHFPINNYPSFLSRCLLTILTTYLVVSACTVQSSIFESPSPMNGAIYTPAVVKEFMYTLPLCQ